MRKLLAVAACVMGAWIFGACGGDDSSGSVSDPVEACKQVFEITCDKMFKCFTKEELDAAKPLIGINTADCVAKFSADCTPEKTNCNAGETYHADKMQSCLDAYRTFTCDDIKADPPVTPAACDQTCTK